MPMHFVGTCSPSGPIFVFSYPFNTTLIGHTQMDSPPEQCHCSLHDHGTFSNQKLKCKIVPTASEMMPMCLTVQFVSPCVATTCLSMSHSKTYSTCSTNTSVHTTNKKYAARFSTCFGMFAPLQHN